ncbi:hypothetical protein HK097_008660 [Rhizophlyctis rosea]|uniref:Uncharacterized protein n=1 Tax=Rhizophlyctis rosea TaxID=64517 RepID=A0AAD5X7T6_9FUNG|nr:hypothetical protein HK097_008660 [Rhizophlyctis rosea]
MAAIRQALAQHNVVAIAQPIQRDPLTPQQQQQQPSGSQSPLNSDEGTPGSPSGAADLQHLDPKQRLIEQLLPHIPAEAIEILYDAGYETLDAIRQLNVNLADPNNDLTSAELYTKKTMKPGHKKLVFQYVSNAPFGFDYQNPSVLTFHSTTRKRRRLLPEEVAQISGPSDIPALQQSLERHLLESPVTRNLRREVDYRVSVEITRDGRGAEGVWKCLVCSSRPVTIALRNGGRQPQLSNVSTHLKTVKHTGALAQRGVGFLAQGPGGEPAALAAAIAAAGAVQHQPAHAQHHAFQAHAQNEESE